MTTRDRIALALVTHPELSDRAIAKHLHHRYWSDVRDVRRALDRAKAVAPVHAPPVARLTPHEEAMSAALVRHIQRVDDAEKYHLRLTLLMVRYRPFYTPTTGMG